MVTMKHLKIDPVTPAFFFGLHEFDTKGSPSFLSMDYTVYPEIIAAK
jgi:hypothetical protein